MALPVYQSMGTVGTGTTSVTPGLPASLATGDGCLIVVVTKPDTATVVTPAGWTLVANVAGGGGTVGNGTGPTQQAWFFREKDATWSTMPAITVTGGSRSASAAFRYTKTAGTVWDIAAATGVYGTSATTTNGSTTLGSNPGLTANDAVIGCFTTQTTTSTTGSAESWTATGISTWGTVTERADQTIGSSTNPGVGSVVSTGSVTTGTSTASPVMNITFATATRGTAVTVRLREVAVTAKTGTETPAVTVTEGTSSILGTNIPGGGGSSPDLSNTAEGTSGNTVSNANSAGPNQVDSIVGTVTYDNANAMRGSTSFKMGPASISYVVWQASIPAPQANIYTRCYLYIDALPSANSLVINMVTAAGSAAAKIQITTAGAWRIVNGAGGVTATGATTVPTGQWVRFELDATSISGTTGTLTARMYTTPDSTTATDTISGAAQTVNDLVSRVWFGPNASNTNNMWVDDIAVSYSAPVGPSGAGGGTLQSDTAAITISETSSVVDLSAPISKSAADTAAITISESSSVAVITAVTASDSCAITISGSSSVNTTTPPTPLVSNNGTGTSGTNVSTSNTGGPNQFDSVVTSGTGTAQFDSLYSPHSSSSIKYSAGTGTAYSTWGTSWGTKNNAYMRTYLYIDAAPSATARIMSGTISGGTLAGAVQITTGRLLNIVDHNGTVVATSTTQVPIGNWVRVELDIFGNAATGTMAARLYLGPDSTSVTETISGSSLNTGGAITQLQFGISSTASSTSYWLGEMVASDTGAMQPTIVNPDFLVVVGDMQPGAAVNPPPSVVAGKITALSPAPNYVLMPGDLANDGTATQYGFFQTMYGSLMSVIYPVPGNHDWVPGNLTAYDSEFTAQGHSPNHYYSFDTTTGWHIIALESDAANVGAPTIGSAQYTWLQSDLAANSGKPIIAFWHHPRWAEGTNATDPGGTGDSTVMQDVWNLLRDYNADLVFTGHTHSYQRFPKFGKTGTADAAGIREFVVGTGGSGLHTLNASGRRTEVDSYQSAAYDQLNSQWFGYLKLWITGSTYSWQFISQNAGVLDSGGPIATNVSAPPTNTVTGSTSTAITITETSSVVVSITASDTAAVTISDSSSSAIQISRTDTAAITATEGPNSGGTGGTAVITNNILTGSTANVTSYASGSFTPTANTLLFALVHATGSVATDTTLTASANGITFTKIGELVHTLSGNVSVLFVANQLVPASPVSMTVTFDCTSDAATGAFIEVNAIANMTKVGLAAVKQTAFHPNGGANQAYAATFSNPTDTNNPVYGFTAGTGAQTLTPPAGFTELNQPADQVTPAAGLETAKVDNGQTATTYTWTSSLGSPTNNTRANTGLLEFDSSGSGPAGQVDVVSSTTPVSTTDTAAITIAETSAVAVTLSTTDTTAITIADASSSSSTLSTNDTVAITIGDVSTSTSTLSTTDTAAITIADSSASALTLSRADTAAITITESSNPFNNQPGTEQTAISITETSSVFVTQPTTDTAAITISDTSSVAIINAISTTDTSAITIAETSAVSNTQSTTDTAAVTIAETSGVAVTQPTTDTTAITIAESRTLAGSSTSTDTTAITIAETSSVAVTQSATDTAAITIADVSQSQSTLSRTDTAAVTITETSAVSGTVTTTDTAAITITESSNPFNNQPGNEQTAVSITETSAVLVIFSTTDTAAITISDVSTSSLQLNRPDTAAITIADVSAVTLPVSTTDTAAVTISDTSSVQVSGAFSLSTSDTAAITISDSSAGMTAGVSGNESVAVTIAETRAVSGTVTTTDTAAVTITETSASFSAFTRPDTAAVTIADSSSLAQIQQSVGNDGAAITIAETSSVQISGVFTVSASDTAAITIAESRALAITNQVVANESIAVIISDATTTLSGPTTATQSVAITITETSAVVSTMARSDTAAITITEQASVFAQAGIIQVVANDTSSIGVIEATSLADPNIVVDVIHFGSSVAVQSHFASESETGIMIEEQTNSAQTLGEDIAATGSVDSDTEEQSGID